MFNDVRELKKSIFEFFKESSTPIVGIAEIAPCWIDNEGDILDCDSEDYWVCGFACDEGGVYLEHAGIVECGKLIVLQSLYVF